MEDSSLVNLALRSVLIWVLVIILMFSVPSAKLSISSVFLISTMVIVLYGLIEYVNLQYSSSIYRMVCGAPDDKYVQDAIAKLKLTEKAGPPVTPVPQVVVATPAPQVVPTPTPQVVPTPAPQVVATPAPQVVATPAPQVVATPAPQTSSTPQVREGFGNYRF